MVKAFSYGSGSYEIANLLQHQRVDYLGVAFCDEGIELRKSGISIPIMVMNPEKKSFDQMIRYQLEPEIYSFKILDAFAEAVKHNNLLNYPIHLKLDTGMHRLGFEMHDIKNLTASFEQQNLLRIKSIFSHLAASDEEIHDEFTMKQARHFENMANQLQKDGHKSLLHILNSAGIERFPEYQYNMVRLGIGLYGISTVDQAKLRNVSSLYTTISQVKNIRQGESVGYNRSGKAGKALKIGTIPVGYADGIDRKLSNGVGKFLVNGKFAPVIGNVCMDMCMIDITETGGEEGDKVFIFNENNPVTLIAKQTGTIPYEVFTGISSRVKRTYFQE